MKLNFDYVKVTDVEILSYQDKVSKIVEELDNRKKDINDFVGWLDIVNNYDKIEYDRIKKAAIKINNQAEVLLVIGIGGSYLGAKAITDAIKTKNKLEIIYVGNNLSSDYISDVIDYIKDKDFAINVISKSGTTTEPAIAFRIFKDILYKKYKEEASNRIYVTTDIKKGALRKLATKEGYESFVIPDNIGGRYSVLTAVGLLPIMCAGINIDKLLEGAKLAYLEYSNKNILENDCYKYAVIRNILYEKGKVVEVLANYEPKLHYLLEWSKQLLGESQGKDNKGIFPSILDFTTDLHSMGQYIQEGLRNMFETVIFVDNSQDDIILKEEENDDDNLNYLAGKSLNYINKKAMEGTIEAHVEGGVDNILITLDNLNELELGKLIFFFEYACAISCMLLGVNPFNQPGVEAYKKNMFKLLGKPGY